MLNKIVIEDSVTGGHGEVFTNVDCIDELRTKLGDTALNKDWSQAHYITKNYAEASQFDHLGKGAE